MTDEFIVSTGRGYVADIDPRDGDTDYTGDPSMARIFRGAAWREVWETREGYNVVLLVSHGTE